MPENKGDVQTIAAVDFSCVGTLHVACMGNLWSVRPIHCNVKHHIFPSIYFLYTQYAMLIQTHLKSTVLGNLQFSGVLFLSKFSQKCALIHRKNAIVASEKSQD